MADLSKYRHCVWGTKRKTPFLNEKILPDLLDHILQNASQKGIVIEAINGYRDHIHCLVNLQQNQKIEKVIQLIKGESSYWININNLTRLKFEWAVRYFWTSVNESDILRVISYIKNQKIHHHKKQVQRIPKDDKRIQSLHRNRIHLRTKLSY
jgi:REP element-mobilizing transposase RayT